MEEEFHDFLTGESGPTVVLDRQVIEMMMAGGKKYKKTTKIIAVKMEVPFRIIDDGKFLNGEPGDYVSLDSDGRPYPIRQSVFNATYEPVIRDRKPKRENE